MEANLFWISVILLAYAYVLRLIDKKTGWLRTRAASLVLHPLFCAGIGAIIGFIFSASTELDGPTPKWPLIGAALGVVFGLVQCVIQSKDEQAATQLLLDDQEWCETSWSAIMLAAVIMYAVIQAFKIPSGSMKDTLLIGDHLFVNKFIYGVRVPFTEQRVFKVRGVRRGDVVVFEAPPPAIVNPDERERHVKKDFIKRAIGLPGDIIQIKDKKVYVNGQPQTEPYAVYKDPMVYPKTPLPLSAQEYQAYWQKGRFDTLRRDQVGDNFGPITVPEKSYFVMGDNRDNSFDARFWGPVPDQLLKGKALLVYWPFNRVKWIR